MLISAQSKDPKTVTVTLDDSAFNLSREEAHQLWTRVQLICQTLRVMDANLERAAIESTNGRRIRPC